MRKGGTGLQALVVEDHREGARWVSTELTHAGWRVHVARTFQEGLMMARHGTYDVVLLDIMLPDGDGLELCKSLRMFTNAAIIMVTARQEVSDRVTALNDGADDYLMKPFSIEELIARMRAVLRRTQQNPGSGPVLEFGDLRLWPEERRVEQNGVPLKLGRREFDLLEVLMKNANRVLTREQLLEQAWGYDFYGESNVVDVTIRRLRERFDPNGRLQIGTVRGIGYILREAE